MRFALAGSMATAPQASESEAWVVGLRSQASMSERQLAPSSSDRHTPPFEVAAKTGLPPDPTAKPRMRPLVAGLVAPCPWRTAEGPIGIQLFAGGGDGGWGGSSSVSSSAGAA